MDGAFAATHNAGLEKKKTEMDGAFAVTHSAVPWKKTEGRVAVHVSMIGLVVYESF